MSETITKRFTKAEMEAIRRQAQGTTQGATQGATQGTTQGTTQDGVEGSARTSQEPPGAAWRGKTWHGKAWRRQAWREGAWREDAWREDAWREDASGLLRAFWAKLRQVGRNIPFAEDLLAAYYCVMDPATPRRVRLILLGAIAYFVLPTDAVPDLLPLIGFTDDAAMIAAAITQVAGSITEAHREKARAALQRGEP